VDSTIFCPSPTMLRPTGRTALHQTIWLSSTILLCCCSRESMAPGRKWSSSEDRI
jgi:hypothetical protein